MVSPAPTNASHLGLSPMQGPTRRELILITALVLLLLSITAPSGRQMSSPHPSLERSLPVQSPELSNQSLSLSIQPRAIQSRLDWGSGPVPQTSVVAQVPGWSIFDRLYVLNGTLYLVSDEPSEKLPDLRNVISKGLWIDNGEDSIKARLPSEKEMRIIGTEEAKRLFGGGADLIDGITWLANDLPQFVTHYYHWAAELFFGFWRTHTSLDPYITADGTTILPPPRRITFVRLDADHWRDYASMNQWIVRTVFPSLFMEFAGDWQDRAQSGRVEVYDRVVLADRAAAMRGFNFLRTQRTVAEAFALPGSLHWWSPIRNTIVDLALSRVPAFEDRPVITYISRQDWGRRMLIPADHDRLVEELYRLRDTHGYEVNVVSMDKLSRVEQFQLAGRTTIMMGVHGNGLTSLLWMKPSSRSTVMEFFFPGGFAMDYEWTTRALGMVHYGFHGDKAFTRPNVPAPAYPEGFQGNSIPLDGALVAKICIDRLTLVEELDEA